jgi:hypothetical protein
VEHDEESERLDSSCVCDRKLKVRVNGDLAAWLRGLPAKSLAAGADPAAIAATSRHPMLLQMLMWIASRTQHGLWGGRHELTGPEVNVATRRGPHQRSLAT